MSFRFIRGAVISGDDLQRIISEHFCVKLWLQKYIDDEDYEFINESWLELSNLELVNRIFTDNKSENIVDRLIPDFRFDNTLGNRLYCWENNYDSFVYGIIDDTDESCFSKTVQRPMTINDSSIYETTSDDEWIIRDLDYFGIKNPSITYILTLIDY